MHTPISNWPHRCGLNRRNGGRLTLRQSTVRIWTQPPQSVLCTQNKPVPNASSLLRKHARLVTYAEFEQASSLLERPRVPRSTERTSTQPQSIPKPKPPLKTYVVPLDQVQPSSVLGLGVGPEDVLFIYIYIYIYSYISIYIYTYIYIHIHMYSHPPKVFQFIEFCRGRRRRNVPETIPVGRNVWIRQWIGKSEYSYVLNRYSLLSLMKPHEYE